MKQQFLIILFFLACILTTNIYAQFDVPSPEVGIHQPTINQDAPAQTSFKSSSYYNNSYSVPFAAENIEIGNNNPNITTRQNITTRAKIGGEEDPNWPSYTPLGNGIWFLLICALGAALRITFKRTEKANIQ